ncbi:MAG: type II toxin-antitoxin system RelB/DinJ family antitoxin [Candidatus Enteromonas sp.]
MASVNVIIRMDETLKKEAEGLFSDFNLTLNGAIGMLLKQAVREQRIPFEVTRRPLSIASDSQLDPISKKLLKQNKGAYQNLANDPYSLRPSKPLGK